jgi:flagellar hook-length control protein FliK
MNLPSIVNTLANLGGNAAALKAGQQQASTPSTPFNQLLSREVAQRPPSQSNAAPQPPSSRPPQQQARAPEAARPQPNKAEPARQSGRAEAAEQPPAQAGTAGPASTQTSEAAQTEQPATEDSAASLADIPGAPQAALMMQLMASATAAATTAPAQEAGNTADLAPSAAVGKGGKDGKDGAAQGPLDLRAPAGALRDGEPTLAGKGEGQAAPDLHAAFGKAVAEAASQRPVAIQAATQADAAAPATALATLQAATQTVHAPTAHVDKLTPAVGTPAWDQALGQKIVWMAQGGEQSASLTMNPPDLGPMQVVLSVSNNQATVEFMAAQPEVRQALEAALPRLRDMMSESGIQLGQANVSAGGQQQFAGSDGGGRSGGRGNDHAGAEAPQVRQGMVRIARDGTVDTFA